MAKRSRRKSNLAGEVAIRIAGLAGLGAFWGGLTLFKDAGASNTLLFSTFFSVAVMLGTALIFRLLFRLFRRKPTMETTFNFDEPPPTAKAKLKQATEFEYEVAALIQQMTGKRTEVVGGAGDGGINIKVYGDDNRLVGIVQCKNIAPDKHVYPSYIRDLNTVRHLHHVNSAYLVSMGKFSEDSRELARKLGIKLIDGATLQQLRRKAVQAQA